VGLLFNCQKGRNYACYKMDKPWGHYAKSSKPVTNTCFPLPEVLVKFYREGK
jgi:hypothetical protein